MNLKGLTVAMFLEIVAPEPPVIFKNLSQPPVLKSSVFALQGLSNLTVDDIFVVGDEIVKFS